MAGFTPRYDRRNVLTGQSQLWVQPINEAAALPDDIEALGYDWSQMTDQGWYYIGASQEGVTMRFTRETSDITIEEQSNPVDVNTSSLDPRIEVTLSEDTLDTMRLAYGGGEITEVAAATGTPGTSELRVSQLLENITLGMEAEGAPLSGVTNPWRRVLMPVVVSVGEVETSYRRAESNRMYACSFRMLNRVEDMIIREKKADAA